MTETITENGKTLKDVLEESNIQYFSSDNINKDKNLEKNITKGTLGIGFGPAWFFNKDTINKFKGNLVNFHNIPMPKFMGGAHYSWQIMMKNKSGGCHIQIINEPEDTYPVLKPVIYSKNYKFPKSVKIPQDYFDFAFEEDLSFLKEFISKVKKGSDFESINLDKESAITFPRLNTKKHGFINWNMNTEEIELFICAFDDPYPGASTFINGKRVFLKKVYTEFSDGPFHPFQSGLVYRKSKDALFVATRNGTLIVKEIIYEDSSSAMGDIKLGDRFYTPQKHIEESMLFRAVYDAGGLK